MPIQPSDEHATSGLSCKERGAIERFLAFIEDRVRDAEPDCAELVRMARLALLHSDSLSDPDGLPH